MLRLVAYAPNGVRRYPVSNAGLVIGSAEECDVHLPFSGVARRHAQVRRVEGGVEIEDLGSRRPVLVNGERVRHAALRVLDEVRLGRVTLLLEDAAPAAEPAPQTPRPRQGGDATPESLLSHVAAVSDWVILDTESRTTIESLVAEMLEDLGGGACFLCQGERGEVLGTRFVAVTETPYLEGVTELVEGLEPGSGEGAAPTGRVANVPWLHHESTWTYSRRFTVLDRGYLVVFALPHFGEKDWSPAVALGVVADLLVLGLVHHVGRFEPILPGHDRQADLVLAPGLIVGNAQSTARLLAELRTLVSSETHVILCGESGCGREAIARTLHLSSSRASGNFVVASCEGAASAQIEADLFGVEIAGKDGPVRREPRLLDADGGTLFLQAADRLPLDLQGRLARVLRSGVLEGPGEGEARPVDLRIIGATEQGLETRVAEGGFRVDLAYQLGEATLQVPSLRERMEDVPLLIQALINRFSHETGQRVRGITVQALQLLSRYHFPGNLRELENVIRQMVFRATPGEPMGVDLLPREVRSPRSVPVPRAEADGDLDLSRLVAACEVDAIREALRRTDGNKSQAARVLGLSRNGLAKKMARLGLDE